MNPSFRSPATGTIAAVVAAALLAAPAMAAVLAAALLAAPAMAAVVAAALLATPAMAAPAQDRAKLGERASDAAAVLEEIMGTPDASIPESLLRDSRCVAVIPGVVKVGFIFGGRHGRGLLSCRVGAGWSRPSYIAITGGSFGLQIGAQATDFVLIFSNERAARALVTRKITLGGDASVSAGPVGRTAEAGTDATFRTEIYSYSRSKGLFAGLSLEGSSLSVDVDANGTVYQARIGAEALLFDSSGHVPDEVAPFLRALQRHDPAGF
jgi:lipid-binding SYLF domain-containing protein